jgi:DTW domain-containing protein YfiP
MLGNLRILRYGGGEPFNALPLAGEGTLLLTPDAKSTNPAAPPRRLVLLDGTFRQARRMFKKIPELRNLQPYALSAVDHRVPGLRRPPRGDGLSTIEAIARALAQFEAPEVAAPLLGAYTEFVRRAELARGRRTLTAAPSAPAIQE